MGSKTIRCPRCQTRKPRTAFYPDKHRKIGVAVYCKICSREVSRISNSKHKKEIAKRSKKWRETHPERIRQLSREWHRRNPSKRKQYNLKSRHGITLLDYKELCKQQNYKCLICGNESKLYVDHNHLTHHVAGLLCNHCNCALGLFKENPKILKSAIKYLQTKLKRS